MELYKKYRPRKLSALLGQESVVSTLRGLKDDIPHCILLIGPTGCGKTTTGRILARRLNCSDGDFTELNCAGEARGIDTIREISRNMSFSPMNGDARVWLLDEVAKLTSDAQTALLKMLEDTPEHVYFFLATTDPQRLIKTIRSRATELVFKSLSPEHISKLLQTVAEREEFSLSEDVSDAIVSVCEGSARKALVLLDQVVNLEDEDKQLEAVHSASGQKETIDLCRALTGRSNWKQVAKILKNMPSLEQEPERVRRAVLGYCSAILLNGAKRDDVASVLDIFCGEDVYTSGRPGIISMCYRALHGS